MNESYHTYEWGSHVTPMNEWVMSHLWMSHEWVMSRLWMSESCHTYEWVMSHLWMSESCHIYEWVMNESCHAYEWVISHGMRYICKWMCMRVGVVQGSTAGVTSHIFFSISHLTCSSLISHIYMCESHTHICTYIFMWHTHICTYIYVWHTHVHICDMAHMHEWQQDSTTCVPWLIHHTTHSHDSSIISHTAQEWRNRTPNATN